MDNNNHNDFWCVLIGLVAPWVLGVIREILVVRPEINRAKQQNLVLTEQLAAQIRGRAEDQRQTQIFARQNQVLVQQNRALMERCQQTGPVQYYYVLVPTQASAPLPQGQSPALALQSQASVESGQQIERQ